MKPLQGSEHGNPFHTSINDSGSQNGTPEFGECEFSSLSEDELDALRQEENIHWIDPSDIQYMMGLRVEGTADRCPDCNRELLYCGFCNECFWEEGDEVQGDGEGIDQNKIEDTEDDDTADVIECPACHLPTDGPECPECGEVMEYIPLDGVEYSDDDIPF